MKSENNDNKIEEAIAVMKELLVKDKKRRAFYDQSLGIFPETIKAQRARRKEWRESYEFKRRALIEAQIHSQIKEVKNSILVMEKTLNDILKRVEKLKNKN